ncbi:hypothetical protein F8S13_03475 [Chloroflexia bacterium SDU3-3]|nr:hypothetical protein F8S13_03475 [Chloroflexia bacterium SDU3-3]
MAFSDEADGCDKQKNPRWTGESENRCVIVLTRKDSEILARAFLCKDMSNQAFAAAFTRYGKDVINRS